MRKMGPRIFVFFLIITALFPIRAELAHAAGYENPPSNVSNLENSLSDSIGVFKCSSGTGLGFIGNYLITSVDKAKNINSYFVTSFQNLLNCRFATWDSITATYKSETAVGQMLVNNGDATDYAIVSTKFSGPGINLYDTTIPQKGWWVLVAQYVPDAGIVWKESIIKSINLSNFTFYIDAKALSQSSGGLVFDNLGNFLGLVPAKVAKTADQQLLVSGAPLQCPAKFSSSGTTTNCNVGGASAFRENIWTKVPAATTTATPQATPQISSQVVSAINTVKALMDQYDNVNQECQDKIDNLPEEISTLGSIALFQACDDDYSEAITLESQLNSLDQSAVSALNTINSIKLKLAKFIENVEKTSTEIDRSTSLLLRLSKESSSFQEVLQSDNEAWDTVQNRIEGLPISISNSIRKNPNYRTLSNLIAGIDTVVSKIQDETDGYQDLASASQVNSAISRIVALKIKYSSYTSFSKDLSKVEKLIPAFVCVKGSVVSAIPKTGKCAKGSVKTSTF
jgi:hypothetical protein